MLSLYDLLTEEREGRQRDGRERWERDIYIYIGEREMGERDV
jgi:hypothetical protein